MFSKLFLAFAVASVVIAAPTPTPNDTQVLQFALTLENLENAFYSEALAKFSAQDFVNAGFPEWVHGRFEQIMMHEQTHVKSIQSVLGDQAPQPCTYNFPYTDPRSFVELAMGIEGVGAAAYLGAATLISDKDALSEAAAILSVEQRQVGWISSAVLKEQPWDGPYETPLTPTGVYSLAAQYITSCPSSNPPLPVIDLPALTLSPVPAQAGSTVTVSYANQDNSGSTYVAFFNGLEAIISSIGPDGTTQVPSGLQGTVYAGVVSSDQTPLKEDQMVTGLVILQMPFDSIASEVDNE